LKIRIESHTLQRAQQRGTDIDEIKEVLTVGSPITGKYGRMGKAMVFDFHNERNGVYYEQKRVEVYYIMECGTAVTVTAYVFYGKWEE
jgi:hypothetical protein